MESKEEKRLENFYYAVLWTEKSPVPPVFDEFTEKEKQQLSKDRLFKAYKRGVPVSLLRYVAELDRRGEQRKIMKSTSAIQENKGKLAGKLGWWLYLFLRLFKR